MVKALFLTLALGIWGALFCGQSLAWESYVGKTLTAEVEDIEPGNTLLLRHEGRPMAVRFYGIGIPTMKQPLGAEAHQALREMLPKGARIIVTTVNESEDGLVTALIQYNDHSINNMLVDRGLAWVDRQTCRAFFCRRWHIQEHLAVVDRRGVWALNLSSPPWQWSE